MSNLSFKQLARMNRSLNRRRRSNDRRQSVSTKVKKVRREVNSLKSLMEDRYSEQFSNTHVDIQHDTVAPYWNLFSLCNTVLGPASLNQRNGTKIRAKKLELRINIIQDPASILENRVRVIIFWGKNVNTLAPAATQVYDMSQTVPTLTYSFPNIEYMDSYKIIFDRTYLLKPATFDTLTTTTIPASLNINRVFRLKKVIRYALGNGTGTFADILNNGLYLAFTCSTGTAPPEFIFSSRVTYQDA